MIWSIIAIAIVMGIFIGRVIRYLWDRLRNSRKQITSNKDSLISQSEAYGEINSKFNQDEVPSARSGKAVRKLSYEASNASAILLHLSQFRHLEGSDTAPVEMMQQGIVEVLGMKQGTIAKELLSLVASGAIISDRSHVSGSLEGLRCINSRSSW